MNAIKDDLTKGWLIKAKRNLLSARQLAQGPAPLLDTAAYHCQQAGEKAIKGFLVFHDIRFEKTHDLDVLISQAADIETGFLACRQAGRILAPLAVAFRYPGDYIEPELEEYQEAFSAAQEIYDFVTDLLPERLNA